MSGGVVDGQPVNAAVTDAAFLHKNADEQMPAQLDFTSTNPASGTQVIDIQKNVNALATFLGTIVNQVFNSLPSWATNNRGLSTDSVKQRVEAIDTAFDPTTGHKHTGSAGDAPQISAASLTSVPLKGYAVQSIDLVGVTGASTDVSTQMAGFSPSTNTSIPGAVVNAPFNKVIIRNSANDDQYEDAFGNEVYARLTESTGTWTLSYFVEIAGIETAYSFVSPSGVRWYFQLLANPLDPASPIYSDIFFVPSNNATADVITATTTLQGKTQLATASQDVSGSASSAGTANATVANADHTHRGVASFAKTAGTLRYGAISLTPGTHVTIVDNGDGSFTIDTAGSGGGGGGSLFWIEDVGSPTPVLESEIRTYQFDATLEQALYALIEVPSTYSVGSPINMRTTWLSSDTSGNVLISSLSTLIRTGTDAITSTTNQRTSTNTAVTVSGGTVDIPQALTLDLSDTTGHINSVVVNPGDLIRIKLFRGTDTATSTARVPVYGAEVTFT